MKTRNLKGLLRFADSKRHCEHSLECAAIDRVGILFGICCSLVATLAPLARNDASLCQCERSEAINRLGILCSLITARLAPLAMTDK